MISKSIRIKILSGMLCTGLVFSGVSTSFAAAQENGRAVEKPTTSMDFKIPVDAKKAEKSKHQAIKLTLEVVIKDSIKSNIITQDEGDKVLKYITEKHEKKSKKHKKDKKCRDGKCQVQKGGLFEELVTEGILTKEKSEALREKMHEKRTEMRAQEIEKGLNTLVDNKVITPDQSKKVKEAIIARDAERKENYKKMRNMNEKEREEYMKSLKDTKVSPMKALVDNGTITKDQEREIEKVLPLYNHGHKKN